MIRKDIRKFKYGTRTEIRVVEGYRDQFGKVKQKTIIQHKIKNNPILKYFFIKTTPSHILNLNKVK